jgi:hypothetical protein
MWALFFKGHLQLCPFKITNSKHNMTRFGHRCEWIVVWNTTLKILKGMEAFNSWSRLWKQAYELVYHLS